MDPGKRRHPITITAPTVAFGTGGSTNELGEKVPAYQPFSTRWAEIKPLSAQEIAQASTLQMDVTHKITFPYVSCLSNSFQISYGDRVFQIVGILNTDERNIEHVITAKEITIGRVNTT